MTMDASQERSGIYNGAFNRIVYQQNPNQPSNQQKQQQYHHHHHYHLQHHMAQQNTIPMSGLPSMQCNLGASTSMAPIASKANTIMHQASPNQCYSANKTCIQHSHPQQPNQPVYNQIYQSLQPTYQTPTYQSTQLIATDLQHSTATMPRNQQRLFGNTFRHLTSGETDHGHNLSLNLQQQLQMQHQQLQLQNQKSAPMLATLSASNLDADKSSTLPVHFSHNISPSITNATGSSVGPMTDMNPYWCQSQDSSPRAAKIVTTSTSIPETMTNAKTATTNQRSKLVDSSNASSTSTSSNASSDSKLKSYLTHLVLASNVPFAYAIILVAFLITVIAATSIITILTIVLTITGYTAYPLTENTFNTSLVIGVVCASFALALVTASLVVWRRHCQAAYYYLDDPQSTSRGTNSPQLSETYDDSEYGSIPVNDWAKHVQKLHTDGDIGFSREFEQIQKATSPNLSFSHSQLPENKQKNRYINIVAYDHTRVTLRQSPGQKKPGSDYINANFIDGYNKPRAYIGTQGPLVSTFDDYWRMIWEQRVVIIVMITNLQERGRRKCDMYWPKEGTETYGAIQVKLLQEVVMATYTLRTFTAKNLKMKKRAQGSERIVYQYHYTNWPDHGVPDHPLPVLSFVRKSASANPSGAGAIICHCSAGCGRSGTYIVIDAMLKQIRHRQSINVVDFLKHIRNQRNYLVQTEEQYVFIHDALVEAIESGETEISSKFIAKYIQLLQTGGKAAELKSSSYSIACNGLLQSPNGLHSTLSVASVLVDNPQQQQQLVSSGSSQSNLLLAGQHQLGAQANKGSLAGSATSRSQSAAGQWSLLERQYRLVSSFKAKDFNVVSALKPCNKTKNRTLNLIPLEAHRVHITPKPGADGTDYINATFLMGFNHLREFILTQHPVQDTFSDFWQMVYDHNSQTVVLLSQLSAEFGQFWPQKDEEVDYGSFKVKLVGETSSQCSASDDGTAVGGLITTRDFILRSNQDYYELQTRIVHCPGWPECCGPLANVFDLIQLVQQATQQQASQQKMHDGLATSTTVTIGQEHEPQNGGPVIVVDKFGGTEAATFAVLTTLYKQINFEDAVDVYMYAKLAHLRRPGIWSSQDDYLFLYRAIENYATRMNEAQSQAASAGHQALAASQASPVAAKYQTMTLDRHRHKSLAGNAAAKSQTLRRGHTGASFLGSVGQPNQKQAANGQPASLLCEQPLSKSQLLIDHNNNQLVSVQQPTAAAIMMQRNHLKSLQLTNHAHLLNGSSQTNSNNNSPYNSAVSIGAQSHQHLLAATNGRPSTNGANLLSQQQQPAHQQQSMDQYLYTLN